MPVWAIIGALTPDADNADNVAYEYDISEEAVAAAWAYYQRHRWRIDARLEGNRAG